MPILYSKLLHKMGQNSWTDSMLTCTPVFMYGHYRIYVIYSSLASKIKLQPALQNHRMGIIFLNIFWQLKFFFIKICFSLKTENVIQTCRYTLSLQFWIIHSFISKVVRGLNKKLRILLAYKNIIITSLRSIYNRKTISWTSDLCNGFDVLHFDKC